MDGNYTIYPYAAGQLPVHVYCSGMNTLEPKEYIDLLQGEEKNFALKSGDRAGPYTCNLSPGAPPHPNFAAVVGRTQFSKVSLIVLMIYFDNILLASISLYYQLTHLIRIHLYNQDFLWCYVLRCRMCLFIRLCQITCYIHTLT